MSQRSPDADDALRERVAAALGALAIPGVWLWSSRGEWAMAVPSFLLASLLGLAGVGSYWLVAGRRRGVGPNAWFASAAVPIALASAAAVWATEGGVGWRPALGSVTAGFGIACWLLFVRLAVGGVPDGDTSAGADPSAGGDGSAGREPTG